MLYFTNWLTSNRYTPPHPITKGQQIEGRTHDITSQNTDIGTLMRYMITT